MNYLTLANLMLIQFFYLFIPLLIYAIRITVCEIRQTTDHQRYQDALDKFTYLVAPTILTYLMYVKLK